MKKDKKYFFTYIDGYFPALHFFSAAQNFYLYPLLLADELGYTCIAFVKGGGDVLRKDPHYRTSITIISYKNNFHLFFIFIFYSLKKSIFYSNSHTIRSYLSLIVAKIFFCQTIFMGHIQPLRTTVSKQKIFDLILLFIDKVRLNNESEKIFLVKRGIKESKLFIVPIAVNTSAFYKKKFDYLTRKGVVYYGNLTKQKDLPTIFEAISILKKKNKDIELHLVGSRGDYHPEEDIKKYNLEENVTLHGSFAHGKKLNRLLNEFQVFVTSTKGEGQCLAVYESALAGNALCLPNIMSFTNLFKDMALFHAVGDAKALACNIETYLNDREKIKTDNIKCIKMIQGDFNEDVVRKSFISMLLA